MKAQQRGSDALGQVRTQPLEGRNQTVNSLQQVGEIVHGVSTRCRRCDGFCPSGTLANGLCSECYSEGRIDEIGGFRIAALPIVEAELAEMTAPLTAPLTALLVERAHSAMTPYELGFADAADGELCLPELYFVRREQMVEYAEGHEAYAGPSLLSRQVLRLYGFVKGGA